LKYSEKLGCVVKIQNPSDSDELNHKTKKGGFFLRGLEDENGLFPLHAFETNVGLAGSSGVYALEPQVSCHGRLFKLILMKSNSEEEDK